ncbi:MAG: GNAT family N-acetyltransferase [Candidatus Bipolaricaulota bacterium]
MTIVDLTSDNEPAVRQAAELLVCCFAHIPSGWHTLEEGLAEVRESLAPGRVSRVALDENGDVVGWIGAIPSYGGHVWELHPLVVRPDRQRQGIGQALVADLERLARERGVDTIFIGTDDEDGRTNLSGVDLYPAGRPLVGGADRGCGVPSVRVLPEVRVRGGGTDPGRQRVREAGHPDGEAGHGPGA